MYKKPKGFDALIQALRDCGYEFLADQILGTDPSKVEPPEEVKEDKQAQLQRQLWMQTQLMMKCQEDRDRLEQTIQEKGLTQDEALAYLKDYAGTKEGPNLEDIEISDGPDVDPHPYRKRISMGDPISLTEATARQLAGDVVRYMALGDEIPASNRYARTMRKAVTSMTSSHRDMFNKLLKVVKLDDVQTFSRLSEIADMFFRDGEYTWGQVVALYAFGGYVATHTLKENQDSKLVGMIADFLGSYVSQHLSGWIDEQGGWVSTHILVIGLII